MSEVVECIHPQTNSSSIKLQTAKVRIFKTSDLPTYENGAIASENKICSEVGVSIMKKGGTSVDGTIATGLCIGTLNFYSSGIGGGGFMLIRTANGSSEVIDFREEAGEDAFPEMFEKNPLLAQWSGLGVGVP